MHRGINGIPLFMICILVHNDDNLDILWTIQSTNCRNGEWINIVIISYYNVDMLVWVCMKDSDIPTSYPYISTPVNQLLTMCAVVGKHIYKFIVNPTIQFSTNSNLIHPLCIIWVGVRYYLYCIHWRKIVHLVKVGEYRRSITIIISVVLHVNYIIVGWYIGDVTKIKLTRTILYEVPKGNTMKVFMGRRLMGCFLITQNGGIFCFWHFITNNFFLLRQPISSFLRNSWETWFLMRGLCLKHINIGVYVKWTLIPIIGKLLNFIDTPPGFRAKLNVPLEFFIVGRCSWDKEFIILLIIQSGTSLCF